MREAHEQGLERVARRIADDPAASTTRRPVDDSDNLLDLHYIRTGPRSERPVLVFPGGPGLATFIPYTSLRSDATKRGLDMIMIEHRGVGLSRNDNAGQALPASAMTINHVIDDAAAVLDSCGIDQAVIYGTSYGSYLAQAFGARHPGRVAGMVLDSTILSADFGEPARDELRRHYADGSETGTEDVARLLRSLIDTAVIAPEESGVVLQTVHEFAGPEGVRDLVQLRAGGRGRRTWEWIKGLGTAEMAEINRFVMEFDLAGVIAFRELGYAPHPDGLPLDPGLNFVGMADRFPPYAGEPYSLPDELPRFTWPTAVISGDRDVRTPRAVAKRAVDLLPDGVLVPLQEQGHSALDTHRLAALHVAHALVEGTHDRLPRLAPRISALPRKGASSILGPVLRARLLAERFLPAEGQRPKTKAPRDAP